MASFNLALLLICFLFRSLNKCENKKKIQQVNYKMHMNFRRTTDRKHHKRSKRGSTKVSEIASTRLHIFFIHFIFILVDWISFMMDEMLHAIFLILLILKCSIADSIKTDSIFSDVRRICNILLTQSTQNSHVQKKSVVKSMGF